MLKGSLTGAEGGLPGPELPAPTRWGYWGSVKMRMGTNHTGHGCLIDTCPDVVPCKGKRCDLDAEKLHYIALPFVSATHPNLATSPQPSKYKTIELIANLYP